MSIALIGGMDRLARHYVSEAERLGIFLKVFNVSDEEFFVRLGLTFQRMQTDRGRQA
jgi:hypothetical protein